MLDLEKRACAVDVDEASANEDDERLAPKSDVVVLLPVGLIRRNRALILAPDAGDVLLHHLGNADPDVAELLGHQATLGLGLQFRD